MYQTGKSNSRNSALSVRSMTQVALFGAIIVLLAFTPFLGYIPLGFTRATIIHIRKLSKGHVLHTVLKIPVKCINQTLIAGESLKRNRMNEILRILSHQYMDVRLQLFQTAPAGLWE